MENTKISTFHIQFLKDSNTTKVIAQVLKIKELEFSSLSWHFSSQQRVKKLLKEVGSLFFIGI